MKIHSKLTAVSKNHQKQAREGITSLRAGQAQPSTNLIKNLDFLGARFTFSLPSSSGAHQTSLGGCITIILSLAILMISIPIFSQFLDTGSPTVTTSTEISSKVTTFNLNDQELFIPVTLSNSRKFIVKDYERFATVKLRISLSAYNASSEFFEEKLLHEFDYVLCSQLENDTRILGPFANVSLAAPQAKEAVLCPDFRGKEAEFWISDSQIDFSQRRAEIVIYPCSLEDSTKCAKSDELVGLTLTYLLNQKMLKSADYTNPVDQSISYSLVKLNPMTLKLISMAVGKIKVQDDRFEWRGHTEKLEFSTIELLKEDLNIRDKDKIFCTKAEVQAGPDFGCPSYAMIGYLAKKEDVIVSRSYKRITAILGEFGGMLKLLTAFIFFLYRFYNKSDLKAFFTGQFVGGDQKEELLKRLLRFDQKKEEASCRQHKHPFSSEGCSMEKEEEPNHHPKQKEGEGVDVIDLRQKADQAVQNDQKTTHGEDSEGIGAGFDEIVRECVEQRTSVKDLMDKLDFVDFLQQAAMEEEDRVLLPLALMKSNFQQKLKFTKNQQTHLNKKTLKDLFRSSKSNPFSRFKNKLKKKFKKRKRGKNSENSRFVNKRGAKHKDPDHLSASNQKNHESKKICNQFRSTDEMKHFRTRSERMEREADPEEKPDQRQRRSPIWGYQEAYDQLKASEPQTSLRRLVKGFIIKHVGSFFEANRLKPPNIDFSAQNPGFLPNKEKFNLKAENRLRSKSGPRLTFRRNQRIK